MKRPFFLTEIKIISFIKNFVVFIDKKIIRFVYIIKIFLFVYYMKECVAGKNTGVSYIHYFKVRVVFLYLVTSIVSVVFCIVCKGVFNGVCGSFSEFSNIFLVCFLVT